MTGYIGSICKGRGILNRASGSGRVFALVGEVGGGGKEDV